MTGEPTIRTPKRSIRALKWLAVVSIVMLALLLATYFATPGLVSRFAPQFAEQLGLDTLEVEMSSPGLRGLTIARIRLANADWSLDGANAQITYSVSDLLAGRVETIAFESLQIVVSSTESRDDVDGPLAAGPLLPAIPSEALSVKELRLAFPDTGFVGIGHAELGDGMLTFFLQAMEPEPASRFNIAANLSQAGVFSARFGERGVDGAEFLTMAGAIGEDALQVSGDMEVHGYVLDLASSILGLPPGTGTVEAKFSTQLAWPLAETLAWDDLTVSIPAIAIDWSSVDKQLALKQLDGAADLVEGKVTAGVTGRVEANLAGYAVAFQFPAAYQLIYEASSLTGVGTLDLNATKDDQTLTAELRTFSASTANGLKVQFDADTDAASANLRAQGNLKANFTITEAEPMVGNGDVEFGGSITVGEDPYSTAIQARVSIDDNAAEATGQLSTSVVENAPYELHYDLSSGAGRFETASTIIFSQPLAAAVIPGWVELYDLDSGQIDASLRLDWATLDQVKTNLNLKLIDASAHYDSFPATGVNGELMLAAADIANGEAWQLNESSIRIDHIDIGLPVNDVASLVTWSGDRVQLSATSASLLGGQASASPFDYDLGSGNSDVTLQLQEIDLGAVLALEGDDIVGTGQLNGTLPVIVRNNQISINDGSMSAEPPGGIIRLTTNIAGPSGQPGLDFALLALKDFNYSELDTQINYAENGDLQLSVHLKGRNPAVEQGRPIHYNLNINENVPVLLESLRLQDQVTERIEAEAKK